ncbi:MDR family NADPH-dependent oxidoreductase [Persicirhabdus sediminis]|uniref:enoyl-[acyl-carrier-protein] reductase n=1 Tax=Persicirhabdus sediminis TaxID=454144 RepID=A0A8J7ME35_9BACT|nr:2-enoyl thioester reductase domain-containing protein [Persicirhabdus sediminis]MBK1792189.1 2-enoyl thioester reductase domain-containing protein [Persicirhabdus sediminis]
MKQLIFNQFGQPEDVTQIRELEPASQLDDGQIRVKMLAAPINPADINYIQGIYGVKPELPAVSGLEGCGEVIESASAEFSAGDKVIFIQRVGTWQSELICPAESAVKVPAEIDAIQASMLKVNPLTAWLILREFENLKEGDYLIQNAANSGVGACVIQLAKSLGIKTINLVRREELIDSVIQLGGDEVFLDNKDVVASIKEKLGDVPIRLASNAVGGDSALRLMDALAPQGTMVTYGAMSRRSLKVPNKFLIFKLITLRGLWVTEWMKTQSRDQLQCVYSQLAELMVAGQLAQPVDSIFSIDDAVAACLRAQEDKRDGKVVFEF